MIIKILASMMIIFCSAYAGSLFAAKFAERVRQLADFQTALSMLEFDIVFLSNPLYDAMVKVADSQKGVVQKIFRSAAAGIAGGKGNTAGDMWERALRENRKGLAITDPEVEILADFAQRLGSGDTESQVNNIRITAVKLKVAEEAAAADSKKNGKLYRGLGVLGGALLVILFF